MRILKIIIYLFLGAYTLSYISPGYADEGIIVRLEAKPANPWIGQKVILQLDVLAKDGWAQLKTARHIDIPGGYVQRFETQGTRLQESIDGIDYSGQRYEFLFFAQRDEKITIPAIPIDVEVKTWDQHASNEIQRLETLPVTLVVRNPPGLLSARGLVSTPDFSVGQKWQPEDTELAVGDAVIRTISLEASDVSGMVFTPLVHTEIDGIGGYPAEPIVKDDYYRGDLRGKRFEKVTYILEKAGSFSLPALEFTWWNIEDEKLEKLTLPGLSLEVSGATVSGADPSVQQDESTGSRPAILAISLLIALMLTGFILRKRILLVFQEWQKKRLESESLVFREVQKAASCGNSRTMLRATMHWLDHISPGKVARLDLFLKKYGDTTTLEVYTEFISGQQGGSEQQRVNKFQKALSKSRLKWHNEKKIRQENELLLPEIRLKSGES